MKGLSACLVVLIAVVSTARYVWQIRRREIRPTLAMWLIFLLGAGLSLVTYAIAERRDFVAGILNTVDVAVVAVILAATLAWGDRSVRLRPFDRAYLVAIAAIVAYGLATGDAFRSNLFTQSLIALGYVPTLGSLVREQRNTESFFAWTCGILAAGVGLYPAIVGGNRLAMLYAARTIVCIVGLMSVMAYYELRGRRARASGSSAPGRAPGRAPDAAC